MSKNITVNRARKILGKSSNKFTDEEIENLIDQFSSIAEIVTTIVGSKQTTTGIETQMTPTYD